MMPALQGPGSAGFQHTASELGASKTGQRHAAADNLAEVKKRVAMLERELADSERTHQLRSAHVLWQAATSSIELL